MFAPRSRLWLSSAALLIACAHPEPTFLANGGDAERKPPQSAPDPRQQMFCADLQRTGGTVPSIQAWSDQERAREALKPPDTPRPEVRGSLSKASIRQVLASITGEMRACFECALDALPPSESSKVTGRRPIQFIIAPEGHVAAASYEGVDVAPSFTQCMLGALQTVRFPPPEGGGIVVVAYPWIFEIGDPPLTNGTVIYPLPHGATR